MQCSVIYVSVEGPCILIACISCY